MPLRSISSAEALSNVKRVRVSNWPDGRKDRRRLHGVAEAAFEPSFHLTPGEAVFTVGSCFARNIEQRLAETGFEVPTLDVALPAEERASDTANDFLNKYTAHSILNELRWRLDPDARFPDAGLVQVTDELWHDPHSAPNVRPAPLERVLARRKLVSDIYARVPDCRIVVITLGLVEAWWDEKAACYLNGPPPKTVMAAEPSRFRLDVMTVPEVVEALNGVHDLLSRFGHPEFRMLLTVSPVPLKLTFTGRDAILANTYSKSVLRVAAEMFVLQHANVDYFPSYEIVTHTVRSSAFIQDNRHVTPQVVQVIADRLIEAYCGEDSSIGRVEAVPNQKSAAEIQKAIHQGDFARAAKLYARLDVRRRYKRAGFDEFGYRFDYGRVLMRIGAMADAQAQLAAAAILNPRHPEVRFQLARALARLQRPLDAEEEFRAAVTLAPETATYRFGLANQLCDLGRFDEAEAEIETVKAADPADDRIGPALAVARSRRAKSEQGAAAPVERAG